MRQRVFLFTDFNTMSIKNPPFTPEEKAYLGLYDNKTILLKISGSEIDHPDFEDFCEQLLMLTRQGLRFVVVYGGGQKIDQLWNVHNPDDPRPKIDGVGITTDEMLNGGVLPALEHYRNRINEIFDLAAEHVDPKHIQCTVKDVARFGRVGTPHNFVVDYFFRKNRVAFVPFVGVDEHGNPLNLNADEVAYSLAEQFRDWINEIVFITPTGGVLNHDDKVISLLTSERIQNILNDGDSDLNVNGGMKEKLRQADKLLKLVPKVAITHREGLRAELLSWKGSGTLCLSLKAAHPEEMREYEEPIFLSMFHEQVAKGNFRPRNIRELTEVADHYRLLKIKNSILGGVSLIPREENWLEFACLWGAYIGNGVGKAVIEMAQGEALKEGKKLFAFTDKPGNVSKYVAAGFIDCGDIIDLQQNPSGEYPESALNYAHAKRGKRLLIWDPARAH